MLSFVKYLVTPTVFRNFNRNLARSMSFEKGQSFPLRKFEFHRLSEDSIPSTTTLTKADALKYFKDMTVLRLMENEAAKLYMEKAIKGFCHLYTGQEACAVGIEAVISRDDSVITAYRSHGWTYTRGVSIADIMCELTGKETGCTKGVGGSMHTYGHEFYGGNGIVGAQVPLGTGVALAHKLRKNGKVCVTLYGDGAANQGQVFEAYNMAALWKLPVIYVCENNLFGMGTSSSRAAACPLFYTRGNYIPGIRVEGNCVLSVREATRFCYEYVKSGKGPIVVELLTYRYTGHSMSDPGTSYRSTDDVSKARKTNDPITCFTELVLGSGLVNQTELDAIKSKIEEEVEEARNRALNDKFPDASKLGQHVLQGGTKDGKVRGCAPFTYYDSSN